MVVNNRDGFGNFERPTSTHSLPRGFSNIHIGIVTASNATTYTVFVRVPALNDASELGPYRVLKPFKYPVVVTVSAVNYNGVYGNLIMPAVGAKVILALIDGSLDDGVILGEI